MYTNSDIVSPLQSCLFNGSLVISVTCMLTNSPCFFQICILRLCPQRLLRQIMLCVLFSDIFSTFVSVNKQAGPPVLYKSCTITIVIVFLFKIDRIAFFFQTVET